MKHHTRDIPNQCRHLLMVRDLSGRKWCKIPSAPVASTMAFTFVAKSLLVFTVADALVKPVSPQPPIATIILVPSANLERTSSTVVKRGHLEAPFSLKMEDGKNAIATCVTSDTNSGFGMT